MAKPAVPDYLGKDFKDTPPGHRFTLYFSSWSSDQEEYQIDYAEYEKEHEEWIKRGARGKEPNSPQHPHQNRDWIIPDGRNQSSAPLGQATRRSVARLGWTGQLA